MKLRPITKIDKKNKITSKKFNDDVMSGNCDVIVILWIFASLEQSGGRMTDTKPAEVMFSVTVTFCLTKTENSTKKSLTQLSHFCIE